MDGDDSAAGARAQHFSATRQEDLLRRRHRPNAEIEAIAGETLDFIRGRNLAIELSTAGWRKPVNELYPSDQLIKLAMQKGIPFTTSSDAHSHVQLGENFERLAEKMSILGVREVCVYEKHRRIVKSLIG